MPLIVRRAAAPDLPTLVEFNRRLAKESEGKTLDPAVLTAGIAAALADPATKGPYFLAMDGGEIVGQMQITYEFSDWRNGWFWWVQGVYVRADARRRGVFRALYEHVREQAKQAGNVIGLRLYVETANHVAQKTYERLGFVPAGYLLLEQYPL
jgi:GNAT superfamily N-acetyltransferase